MGRPCVFRHKAGGMRVHGVITKIGRKRFEEHRRALSKLSGITHPSDADVVEYLARGEAATRDYLAKQFTA